MRAGGVVPIFPFILQAITRLNYGITQVPPSERLGVCEVIRCTYRVNRHRFLGFLFPASSGALHLQYMILALKEWGSADQA